MIKIDFPVKNIKFGFNIVGQSFLMCTWNGEPVLNGEITEDKIKDENILSISFAKINPADEESFATLQYFLVNNGSFKKLLKNPKTLKLQQLPLQLLSALNILLNNEI